MLTLLFLWVAVMELEMSTRISEAWAIHTGLKQLWWRPDILLKLTGPAYCATVDSVLCGCKTHSMLIEDAHHSEVFDHRCPRSIVKIGWSDCVSNVLARNQVVDAVFNLFYHSLSSLWDYIGWVMREIRRIHICHTVPSFLQSGKNYVKVSRWRDNAD